VWPRRIQDFYDELVAEMMKNRHMKEPNLDVVLWVRGRVYDALSFCQTGPEIVDSCSAALLRYYETHAEEAPPAILWEVMESMAQSEPHTSYRTPLALEWAVLNMFDVMRRKTQEEVNGCGTSSTSSMACVSENKTTSTTTAAAAAAAATQSKAASGSSRTKAGAKSSC
jgi:hypothetical protein